METWTASAKRPHRQLSREATLPSSVAAYKEGCSTNRVEVEGQPGRRINLWDKRWQLCDIDYRGLALKPVRVRVCVDCKGEGCEAWARTIARERSFDVAARDDAAPDRGVARQSFKGV